MSIILASKSPRRKELLSMFGLPFLVVTANTDEPAYTGGTIGNYVAHLAELKARAVFTSHPDDWIIGADTVVYCGNKILGKPGSEAEAKRHLSMLQNCSHTVYTGIALLGPGHYDVRYDSAKVCFMPMTESEIDRYIATGEPLDKAGSYGIQGRGGIFVKSIEGNYYTVVGLPLSMLNTMMKEAGILER